MDNFAASYNNAVLASSNVMPTRSASDLAKQKE